MATMLPNDIQTFTTDGEGTVYRFLQACAKPDNRYLAWYQPDILGREPDFILYAQDVGLVIFEVKDWALDQIVTADPQFFTLRVNGKRSSAKTPSSRSGIISGGSWTKSKRTVIWYQKIPIPMARSG
jgi:hypothetical protein